MLRFLIKLLHSYDYKSVEELFYSIFPSWKYHLQSLSLALSALIAVFSSLFGFGPLLVVAMLVAIFVEIQTGIKASQKQGNSFESFRFSRCFMKLAFWAAIFFVIHAFEKEYEAKTQLMELMCYYFFKILFMGALTLFLIEHLTSILENKAIIDDKPKTYFIEYIQATWKDLLQILKSILLSIKDKC